MTPSVFYLIQDQRRTHIRALRAVSQFRLGQFNDAIDSFLELDLNPAKVLALYPERVAGRLSVPQDDWIPLFGGPPNQSLLPGNDDATSMKAQTDNTTRETKEKPLARSASPAPSVRTSVRRGTAMVGSLLATSKDKDDDVASISGKKKVKPIGWCNMLSPSTCRTNNPFQTTSADP